MWDRLSELRQNWRILLASTFGVCFGMSGLTIFSFGVFIIPLTEQFGWSRGQVAIASSFLIIANSITAPLVGAFVDRFGGRRIAIGSLVALAIGYAVLSQVGPNLMLFYAIWMTLALCGGGTTNVAWTRAVNMTFDRGRGLALSLMLIGSGTAAMLAPVLCTKVIIAAGWRAGYGALAASYLLFPIPFVVAWFREPQKSVSHVNGTAASGILLKESIRDAVYWKLAASFFLVSLAGGSLIIHLVPMLVDRGMTQIEAASVASLFGMSIVLGRLANGLLVDVLYAPAVGAVFFIIAGLGCALLLIDGHSVIAAVIAVMTFGAAGGAEIHLLAFLIARFFGLRDYGKIYGFQLTTFYIAAALGPLCGGLMYDAAGSYTTLLYCCGALFVASGVIVVTLGRYPTFAAATPAVEAS